MPNEKNKENPGISHLPKEWVGEWVWEGAWQKIDRCNLVCKMSVSFCSFFPLFFHPPTFLLFINFSLPFFRPLTRNNIDDDHVPGHLRIWGSSVLGQIHLLTIKIYILFRQFLVYFILKKDQLFKLQSKLLFDDDQMNIQHTNLCWIVPVVTCD